MVRDTIGPVAAFKIVIVIKRLPKTRSGKILRGTIRKIADNEEYKVPATIDDPAILTEIKEDLIKNNILKDLFLKRFSKFRPYLKFYHLSFLFDHFCGK